MQRVDVDAKRCKNGERMVFPEGFFLQIILVIFKCIKPYCTPSNSEFSLWVKAKVKVPSHVLPPRILSLGETHPKSCPVDGR